MARRRRDRHLYDGFAIAKPMRVVDPDALQTARERGFCEVCEVRGPTEPHHVRSVGSGGGDTKENLISVCRLCHDRIHRAIVSRAQLRNIIALRKR
jgi:hypothetical protein